MKFLSPMLTATPDYAREYTCTMWTIMLFTYRSFAAGFYQLPRPRRPQQALLAMACGLVLLSSIAHAAKWSSCPSPPLPVYPSVRGATVAPFIHPGHAFTIVLNAAEAASAGFSLAPDGNHVAIVFHSLFGSAVVLAPRAATTSNSAVLTFEFPDTSAELGRGLAGPVDVQVVADGRTVAHIAWWDLVALPAASEVSAFILGQNPEQVVQAALAADGALWVPAAFHGEPMDMPGCPGNFIEPAPIQIAAAEIVGVDSSRRNPLARVRNLSSYLGDVVIQDQNFYGMRLSERIQLLHVADTLGVSLCRLNDAIDLVLRMRGNISWARGRRSPFAALARDSSPISLRLTAARLNPASSRGRPNNRSTGEQSQLDSFGNVCPERPAGRRR
ncbi:MAG: hypothetical protein HY699_17885 [Deltaproteobacteria bacterium]|nr:hypothetical protein [Deltaproteobacteria bacterium]